jgi:transcriptional regulator with XRE-family HTH domain
MNENKNIGEWVRAEMARDPALAQEISKYELNAEIAVQILHFRKLAGLTQKELAEKSRTKQSVISRIEDDEYEGHSLKSLHKIAWALGLHLIVKFSKEREHLRLPDSNESKTEYAEPIYLSSPQRYQSVTIGANPPLYSGGPVIHIAQQHGMGL